MKISLTDRKRKILRKIYGTLSFTSALFIFQACYGVAQDRRWDTFIQGYVKSEATAMPIPGIKVSLENNPAFVLTDGNGNFKIFTSFETEYNLKFQDIDSTQNGSYQPKDTLLKPVDISSLIYVNLDTK